MAVSVEHLKYIHRTHFPPKSGRGRVKGGEFCVVLDVGELYLHAYSQTSMNLSELNVQIDCTIGIDVVVDAVG